MLEETEKRIEALEMEVYRNKSVSRQSISNFFDVSRGNLKIPARDTTPARCVVGEMVEVGGSYYICTAQDTWTELSPSSLSTRALTAGESIGAGKAVSVSELTTTTQSATVATRTLGMDTTTWFSQKITTPTAPLVGISTAVFKVAGTGGGYSYTVQVRTDSGGLPTSTVVGTSDTVVATTTGDKTFTFSPVLSLSASTDYHVVLKANTGAGQQCDCEDTAGGGHGTSQTTNSGTSWADYTYGQLYYTFTFRLTEEGLLFLSNSTSNDFYANSFIGFAPSAITVGSAGKVIISGIVTGLSGLTIGKIYFLQDTDGAIGTSAGSQSRKIGVALSATSLLLRLDNP